MYDPCHPGCPCLFPLNTTSQRFSLELLHATRTMPGDKLVTPGLEYSSACSWSTSTTHERTNPARLPARLPPRPHARTHARTHTRACAHRCANVRTSTYMCWRLARMHARMRIHIIDIRTTQQDKCGRRSIMQGDTLPETHA